MLVAVVPVAFTRTAFTGSNGNAEVMMTVAVEPSRHTNDTVNAPEPVHQSDSHSWNPTESLGVTAATRVAFPNCATAAPMKC